MSRTVLISLLVLLVIVVGALFVLGNRDLADTPDLTETSDEQIATNSDMLVDGGMEISAGPVEYFDGVTGYYAEPTADGEYPGIVMIHEWWGLNDNIRDMADELAGEGYRVLAVDLFGSVATTPDEARAQTGALDEEEALANMQAAAEHLRTQNATQIASLGWCFGGGQSLRLSLSDEDLAATVIYYGQLETDQTALMSVDAPVLGVFGAEDTSIPVSEVEAFEMSLAANETPHEVHIYPGVGHAFANPSNANYAPEETSDAWEKTLTFLNQNLK